MIQKAITPLIIVSLLLLVLIPLVEAKLYSKNVPIMNFRRENGWLFIDRININPGMLEIQLKIKFIAPDYKIGSKFALVFSALPA